MKIDSTEVWKDVKGFEDLYQVSSLGRVRSLDRVVVTQTRKMHFKGKVLSQINQNAGYKAVFLCKRSKYTTFLVHRLVLLCFVGKCPEGHEVCHNNGNKHDNRLDNLRYGTRSENCKDRLMHGRARKLTLQDVEEIKRLRNEAKWTQQKIADNFGVSQVTISSILLGKTWKF